MLFMFYQSGGFLFSFFYSDLKLVFKWPPLQVCKDINREMLLQKYQMLP